MSIVPTDDETFEQQHAAFLASSDKRPDPELPPAPGFHAFEAALADAQGHGPACGTGGPMPIIIEVTDTTGASSLQTIPTGVNPNCVMAALAQQDTVASITPIGFVHPDDDLDPEAPAVAWDEVPPSPDVVVTSGLKTYPAPMQGSIGTGPRKPDHLRRTSRAPSLYDLNLRRRRH